MPTTGRPKDRLQVATGLTGSDDARHRGYAAQGCGRAPAQHESSNEYDGSFRNRGKSGFQQSILQPAHKGVVHEIHAVSVVASRTQLRRPMGNLRPSQRIPGIIRAQR
jgi:hypothetical protein